MKWLAKTDEGHASSVELATTRYVNQILYKKIDEIFTCWFDPQKLSIQDNEHYQLDSVPRPSIIRLIKRRIWIHK